MRRRLHAAAVGCAIHPILTAPADTGSTGFSAPVRPKSCSPNSFASCKSPARPSSRSSRSPSRSASCSRVLTHWSACNPGRPWWRKREIVTDVCYWFLIPLAARFVRIGLMVMGAAYIYNIHGADDADQVLRRRLRPARRNAAMGAGDLFPGRVGFPDLLDSSRLSWRRLVEIPRRPPFIRRARLDFGGAVSSGQHLPRHRFGRCRRCCWPAFRRT